MLEGLANKLKSILPDAGDALVDKAMGAINDTEFGGLHGLVDKLKAGGLGDTVNSWIETGKKNIPITGDQVRKALGNEQLTAMAKKLGIDPAKAADKIADMLPDAVDAATPTGQLPPK
jgi:uncharacterized protein YidB (DUF937 family)